MKDENEKRLNYLLSLQEDLRDEVKQRISQRDGFATQFLVACGTVVTISFLDFPYAAFLIWLMPLVTIFYSLQILYSYVMHENLSRFLRERIEPEISELLEINQANLHDYFWESRCGLDRTLAKTKYPGIRKGFFKGVLFVMPVVTAAIFVMLCFFRLNDEGMRMYSDGVIIPVAVSALVFFEIIAIYLYFRFKKKD